MIAPQDQKCPTIVGSSISENIHFDRVNGLQITTANGVVNIHKFVCKVLEHHQNLIQSLEPSELGDYFELDYSFHKRLIQRESILAQSGGGNAEL